MKRLGRNIVVFVVGSLILEVVFTGIENIENGKTFFGKNKKRTTVWKNKIYLDTEDYEVV